jgi:hypothetical protein
MKGDCAFGGMSSFSRRAEGLPNGVALALGTPDIADQSQDGPLHKMIVMSPALADTTTLAGVHTGSIMMNSEWRLPLPGEKAPASTRLPVES